MTNTNNKSSNLIQKNCNCLFPTLYLIFSSLVTIEAQEIKYSIEAGPIISNLTEYDLPKGTPDIGFYLDWRVGYQVNGVITFQTHDLLGGTIKLGLIQKGYKTGPSTELSDAAFAKNRFHYLHLPLLLDLHLSKNLTFSVGPEFESLISTTIVSEGKKFKTKSHPSKRFDTALFLSLDFKIKKRYGIGIQFSRGFTHATKGEFEDPGTNASVTRKSYNKHFGLYFRYQFNTLYVVP